MKDNKKSIISWSFYDWANSAFATTVMAGFFPIFFKVFWANPDNPQQSTFYLGIANSAASILVAAMAPFLGAIADKGSAKKKLLMLFAFLGIIMTGALWFVGQGMWPFAILFYILASVGFSGGNIFYDALLVGVASPKKVDFVSSLGFAMGYIGGGLLFLVNVLMYLKPELFGIPDAATAIRLSFLSVSVWWAVFSLPIFLFVKEPQMEGSVPLLKAVKQGWAQLKGTMKEIRHMKVVMLFLLAYWFYIDGVDTIIKMAVDYGTAIGFSSGSLITALLLVQFVAFPSALLYNLYSSKVGIKKGILTAVTAYGILTFLAFFMKTELHFYLLAISVGLFQGGIQALSRSFYSRIIPESKAGEFYGFYNMLGKFAAILGPLLMGTVTIITGSNRVGILSIIILFAIGGILFSKVNMEEGEKMARDYLSE